MTFKLKLDGYMRGYEYAALAIMFQQLAIGAEADRKERGFGEDAKPTDAVGGINRDPSPLWKNGVGPINAEDIDAAPPAEVTGTRVRGQPAPGKARRTKAEIAEDETAGTTTQGISTGESRVGPEDDAETQARDEADEQAEVEAERETDAPLTTEDLKEAMSAYVTKFGIPATQEDGAKMFVAALGKPPAGEAAWKLSLVGAAGQDHIKKAIAVFADAAKSEARYGA